MRERLDALIGPIEDGSARARRRVHMLRVATESFCTLGYRKTSMDQVARNAGVAKGTVYTYYPTKVDLAVAAIALEKREHMQQMLEWLEPERPAEERLRGLMLLMVLMPARMPLTAALLRGDREMAALMADLPPELKQQGDDDRRAWFGDLIDEVASPHGWTQSELDDRVAVITSLAFVSTHLHEGHTRGGVSLERYADILVDTLIAGLRNAGSRGAPP